MSTEIEVKEVEIAVVGAGLVGSLLAMLLARKGFRVEVFERRPDMRKEKIAAGRSINLNISCRGLKGLERAGVLDDVMPELVPMKGRMMHSRDGELTYQPYGKDDSEYGNSVSRAGLNKILVARAEETGLVNFHFNHRASDVDHEENIVTFIDESTDEAVKVKARRIIGTDGGGSAIRKSMMELDGYQCSTAPLEYGYKELAIPPGPGGSFLIEKEALHIWPRGEFMQIALPNFDGSFTVTLFLPFKGEKSFEKLTDEKSVLEFFNTEFGDSVPLMPDLIETFFDNPTGHMETVRCHPWQVGGKALLMGDAAHAIVPFFGQGMNCGFEDVSVFDDCLNQLADKGYGVEELVKAKESKIELIWYKFFERFVQERKANADAIADMALDNFIEMRDKVADPRFLLAKKVEKLLEKRFPGKYVSRYSLVTFTNIPYKMAQDAGVVCEGIIDDLLENLDDAEKVDFARAEKLIDERLAPLLARSPEPVLTSGSN